MAHDVTFIPGDGTGPELTEATRRVLEATGVDFNWDRHEAGIDEYRRHGNPFPRRHARVAEAHRGRDQGADDDAGRLGLSLDQRAAAQGARPLRVHPPVQGAGGRAHALPGDRPRHRAREHRGPLRRASSSSAARPRTRRCARRSPSSARPSATDAGISIKPISVFGSERIVRHAFDYAVTHGRKKVVAAHKANIMKFSDGLFLEVARSVAADYPAIEFSGLHHRQPLQPADHLSGGLRGHRPAQPLRRHRLGPVRRDDRRAGRGGRREHRHARPPCSRRRTGRRRRTPGRTA